MHVIALSVFVLVAGPFFADEPARDTPPAATTPELPAPWARPPRPANPPPEAPSRSGTAEESDLDVGLGRVSEIETWFDWAGISGSASSVLLGMPAPADRAAAAAAGEQIVAIARDAATRLDRAVEAHDRDRAAGAAAPPELESRIGEAIHARTVRLPLRVARAMLLAAAVEPDDARAAKLIAAAKSLAQRAEPVSPWADAERSLLLAFADLARPGTPPTDALASLSTAGKTISDPSLPDTLRDQLRSELAAEIGLATALAIGAARGEHAAAAALDALTSAAPIKGNPALTRLAAETRLRTASPKGAVAGAPESAFAGFVPALRGPADIAAARTALLRLAAQLDQATVHPRGSVQSLIAAWASLDREPSPDHVREALAAASGVPEGSPWNPVGVWIALAVDLAAASPELRLAVAAAGADAAERLSVRTDQLAAIAVARDALAPLGPFRDTDLAHRVFTLSIALGGPGRVGEGATSWGLKEILQAQAARAPFDEAEVLLTKADATASDAGPPCAECWWGLLDALLRDSEAVAERQEQIRRVAAATESAARTLLASTPTAPAPRLAAAAVALTDALLTQARTDEAVASAPSTESHPAVGLLIAVASAEGQAAPASLAAAIARLDPTEAAAWLARLSDRAWARLAPFTRQMLAADSPAGSTPARSSAATLNILRNHIALLPSAQRPLATERSAWGALLAGNAAAAVPLFESVIAGAGRRADLVRGLAESRLASGDDPAAFAAFRDLSAATTPTGATAAAYFQAWTRMIEILDRQNATGDKSETLAREIRRLRLLKPEPVCPPCAERIEAVARKLAI